MPEVLDTGPRPARPRRVLVGAGLALALAAVGTFRLAASDSDPTVRRTSPATSAGHRPPAVYVTVLTGSTRLRAVELPSGKARGVRLPTEAGPVRSLVPVAGGVLALAGTGPRLSAYVVAAGGPTRRIGPAADVVPARRADRAWVVTRTPTGARMTAYDMAGRVRDRAGPFRLPGWRLVGEVSDGFVLQRSAMGPVEVVDRKHGRLARRVAAASRFVVAGNGQLVWLSGGCPHYCRLMVEGPTGDRRVAAVLDAPGRLVGSLSGSGAELVVGTEAVVTPGGPVTPVLLAFGLDVATLDVLPLPPRSTPRAVAYDGPRGVLVAVLDGTRRGGRLVAWRPADGGFASRGLLDRPAAVATD